MITFLRDQNDISDTVLRRLLHEIDLEEARQRKGGGELRAVQQRQSLLRAEGDRLEVGRSSCGGGWSRSMVSPR